MEALNEQFGTAAEFADPKGGIFLWVKLPDEVDTLKLYQPALAAGVAINPGPEWTTDKGYGKSRTRLCFANPSHEAIRAGVAALAEVCRREFGVPNRIANVERVRACAARISRDALPSVVPAKAGTHNRSPRKSCADREYGSPLSAGTTRGSKIPSAPD